MPTFYEFFAGGGMARLGLGQDWQCEFANDVSKLKAESYLRNFCDDDGRFVLGDIKKLGLSDLPEKPDLVWGSFPCQDLSLAGAGRGLNGARSGLIWNLLSIVTRLKKDARPPKMLVLENVTGLLNSNGGDDFYEILSALKSEGYVFGTLMMDAVHFLPQSRPRIFLVAVDWSQQAIAPRLINGRAVKNYLWTNSRLDQLWKEAPMELRENWVWWNVPAPPPRRSTILDILDQKTNNWDTTHYTERLLSLMAPLHRKKVHRASLMGQEIVGTLYRRTRLVDGTRKQRVEVRFDGISGCLRTPTGGSSRQRLLFVNNGDIRSRLLTAREAARLMGVPDSYVLPESYNDGYQIAGDGVAVPVVQWLADHLLKPLLAEDAKASSNAEVQLLYA